MNKTEKLEKELLRRLHAGRTVDVQHRREIIGGEAVSLIFISSLVGGDKVTKLIESLSSVEFQSDSVNHLAVPIIEHSGKTTEFLLRLYEGNAVVLFHGVERCLICDVKQYPSRGISVPEVEKSVRGSKDAFTESLADNIGLIRRRIKSEELMIESFVISKKSQMNVCLFYMKDRADKDDVRKIREKLKGMKLESLVMTDRALEETLFRQKYHMMPLVRYTERPDVASINLIRGKLVLIVDTSCNAILTPVSIFDHLKNVEEYKQNPLIGSFTKTLRLIGTLISVFLVPLFLILAIETGFENGIFPHHTIEGSTNPLIVQVLVISLLLEVIRIAVVHTPNALTSAISLLAAIVLGEVSLNIGLFSPEILLVCSLATICNFAAPSYELSLANRVVSLLLILASSLFGETGFLLTVLIVFLYLVNIRTLSLPYLYPIVPFDKGVFTKLFLRKNSGKDK